MKNWYDSKVLWFNILTLLVTVIGDLTNTIALGNNTLKVLGVIVLVGNAILRYFFTTTAIRKIE